MARILIPIPLTDLDPAETGVPWHILRDAGHQCTFATPDGRLGQVDPRMLTGAGLGPLAGVLMAQAVAREADDIANGVGGARAAGLRGVLVRTGKFQESDLPKGSPDAVLGSLADLPGWLRQT